MHTLDQITAFITVYDEGSYSRAGRKLDKDRTTIRELVKALEDSVDLVLFDIEGRTAKPTEDAQKLAAQFRFVLRQNEKLSAHIKAYKKHRTNVLTVAYSEDFPIERLSFIEAKLFQTYPELSIDWVERGRETSLAGVDNGEIDLAILPAKGLLYPEKTVEFRLLGYINFGVYVGKTTSLSSTDEIQLEDVQFETQYLSEKSQHTQSGIKAFSSDCRTTGSNMMTVQALNHRGWAILPNWVVRKWGGDSLVKKKVTLLANDWKIPFSAFYRVGTENNIGIKEILTYAREIEIPFD